MIKIGVTGTGSLVGQAIIKAIKSDYDFKKSKIIGFDYIKNTVGSLWCSKTYLLPDILDINITEETWINKLIEIVLSEKIDILLIGVDFELIHFAKNKKYFESKTQCKLIVSSKDVIEITKDKFRTYEFLRKNNLYFPKTFIYEPYKYSRNIKNINDISFPLILKPREGASSKGVIKINSPIDFHNNIPKMNTSFICQEYIGSSEKEYTCGILYLDNKIKSSIILNRTLKKGNTNIAVLEQNVEVKKIINKYIEEVISILKPFGPCNIQLRLDKDNIPKIFEINSRFSGTTYMRSLFGLNEVSLLLNYIINKKEIDFKLSNDRVYRFFDEKLIK